MDLHAQTEAAKTTMQPGIKAGQTCISCHKGIAHHLPKPPAPLPVAAVTPAPTALPAGSAGKPAAPATAAAPAPVAAQPTVKAAAFIGQPIVPLAAAPGGAAAGELDVSVPLATVNTEGADAKVTLTLWQKGAAVAAGPLFNTPNGFELGRLDDPAKAGAKAGEAISGWVPVTLSGFVPAKAIVPSLAPVWSDIESNYQFTCGACHALHDPHDLTPAQWAPEMITMAKNANMQPADATAMLKWLQTQSATPKAGN